MMMPRTDAPNLLKSNLLSLHPYPCCRSVYSFCLLCFVKIKRLDIWMYVSLRLRYSQIIQDITSQLVDMALDPRAYPGIAAEVRQLKSSASTPSLRSRESELVPMGRTTPENGGGNVRVVVRVRGFLPRGMKSTTVPQTSLIVR